MPIAIELTNPKRRASTQTGWADLFPYYAGYPESFARKVLASAQLNKSSRVFDPWNGSGSTTTAAAKLGLKALGYDINPVMTIVSRARLLPASEWSTLRPLSRKIIQVARSTQAPINDELGAWFTPETAATVRAIEMSVREHLVEASGGGIYSLSSLASIYYVALFSTLRSLTKPFKASNPTWLKVAKTPDDLLSFPRTEIERYFLDAVERAREACHAGSLGPRALVDINVECADSTVRRPRANSIDLALTSPPYCTRIDYTSATRVELALTSGLSPQKRSELSALMLGSVRVPKKFPKANAAWGPTANEFVDAVKNHPSHASDTYYLKSHLDYFSKLYSSIENIYHALKPGGRSVFVVQDSVYKGIHNNLQKVVEEMSHQFGARMVQYSNFTINRSMRDVNTRALSYGVTGKVTESALVFQLES